MTASVTLSPRYDSASRLSLPSVRALISWGVYFLSSSATVQSVPMWRLTDAMVRSTLVTAWRFAVSPTSTSPSLVKATTEGVVRKPSALAMTVGSPPSSTDTTELVVPRSIPTARAMCFTPSWPFDRLKIHQTQGALDRTDLTLSLIRSSLPRDATLSSRKQKN